MVHQKIARYAWGQADAAGAGFQTWVVRIAEARGDEGWGDTLVDRILGVGIGIGIDGSWRSMPMAIPTPTPMPWEQDLGFPGGSWGRSPRRIGGGPDPDWKTALRKSGWGA